jgi:hypothetical protein
MKEILLFTIFGMGIGALFIRCIILVLVVVGIYVFSASSGGKGWVNRNRSNLLMLIAPAIGLIIIHWIMFVYFENVAKAWTSSPAFKISLIAILFAVLLKWKDIISTTWYFILIAIIPVGVIFIHFYQDPTVGEEPPPAKKEKYTISKPYVPTYDTNYYNVPCIRQWGDGTKSQLIMEPNSQVKVFANNFEQIITTDSMGFKHTVMVEGDAKYAPVGTVHYQQTKGIPALVMICNPVITTTD